MYKDKILTWTFSTNERQQNKSLNAVKNDLVISNHQICVKGYLSKKIISHPVCSIAKEREKVNIWGMKETRIRRVVGQERIYSRGADLFSRALLQSLFSGLSRRRWPRGNRRTREALGKRFAGIESFGGDSSHTLLRQFSNRIIFHLLNLTGTFRNKNISKITFRLIRS